MYGPRRIYLDKPETWRSRRINAYYGPIAARVELDRDAYVDQTREELNPGFKDAAERCVLAGTSRLWVEGYTGGFAWGSGHSYVTLFVPTRMVGAAVRALKAAELAGDITKLDRLTAKLALPLNDWLAPGERFLQLGVDFHCSPYHFLEVLRGEAKSRGLRLNGRADKTGVWVRPAMTSDERMMREVFPERYADSPPPPPEPVVRRQVTRPRVDRQERLRRNRKPSEVRRISGSTPTMERGCRCGFGEAADHARRHLNWSYGVPLPERFRRRYGVVVVDTMAPAAWCRIAYASARAAQREGRYDFASFPGPTGDDEPSEARQRAYLMLAEGHVVGYLAVSNRPWHGRWAGGNGGSVSLDDPTIRPRVILVHVADLWRRKGVGSTLVRALAEDEDVPVSEVSWAMPFSEAGEALAFSLSPGGVWVCN